MAQIPTSISMPRLTTRGTPIPKLNAPASELPSGKELRPACELMVCDLVWCFTSRDQHPQCSLGGRRIWWRTRGVHAEANGQGRLGSVGEGLMEEASYPAGREKLPIIRRRTPAARA